jgi:hypothetical protein
MKLTNQEQEFERGFDKILMRWRYIFGEEISWETRKQPDISSISGRHVLRCHVWFGGYWDDKEDFPVPNNQSGWSLELAFQEGKEAALEIMKRLHGGNTTQFIENYLTGRRH